MQDEYKVKRLREMLETTEQTGFCATVIVILIIILFPLMVLADLAKNQR